MENSVVQINKIICAEGIDGSGKTTLVQRLENFGIYANDRSFITDVAYRIEDGNKPWCNVTLLEMSFVLNHCIVIYCKNDSSFENSIKRGETNVVTKERSDRLSKIYDGVMRFIELFTEATVITYDWQRDNIDDLVKKIKEVI